MKNDTPHRLESPEPSSLFVKQWWKQWVCRLDGSVFAQRFDKTCTQKAVRNPTNQHFCHAGL